MCMYIYMCVCVEGIEEVSLEGFRTSVSNLPAYFKSQTFTGVEMEAKAADPHFARDTSTKWNCERCWRKNLVYICRKLSAYQQTIRRLRHRVSILGEITWKKNWFRSNFRLKNIFLKFHNDSKREPKLHLISSVRKSPVEHVGLHYWQNFSIKFILNLVQYYCTFLSNFNEIRSN